MASQVGKHAEIKPKKKRKKLRIAMIVVASLLVVLVSSGALLLNTIKNPQALFTQNPISRTPPPVQNSDQPTKDPAQPALADADTSASPDPTEAPPEYEFDKDRVNILVLGADSSVERVNAGMNFRTDSMILVSLNLATKEVQMISIPRDSYVRINGGNQRSKINAAFVYGGGAKKNGYQYAMDTVSWTLGGIPVDYYVGFGMQAVKDVVNAMGGIDYDVDISFTMNGRKMEKGMQHLDGQKALDYARYRGSGRGDIDRVDRQQRILFAMFQQMKSTDQIKNIPAIYNAVMDQIDTNLDVLQIAALAYWAKDLDLANMDRHTLEGYGLMIGKTSYWVLDQGKKKSLVKEVFGVDISIPEGEDYGTIKAMAEALGAKVTEVMVLLENVQQGVNSGAITDPGAQTAIAAGHAALITEKSSELDNAIALLSPYRYQPSATTPDPNLPYVPGDSPTDPGGGGLGGGDDGSLGGGLGGGTF